MKDVSCNKNKRGVKVLVACGGTAGHFLPALSFLEALKKQSNSSVIYVVLTRRKVEYEFSGQDFNIERLPLVPIPLRISFKTVDALMKLFAGSLQSLRLILRVKPDIVVGFGGYASFPVLAFGRLLGKRTLIHEQNFAPGIANRLLAPFMDKVAVSFCESKEFFSCGKSKIVVTGNPIRKDLCRVERDQALDYFKFKKDRFTVLVMGGSQGAHKINTEFSLAVQNMKEADSFQAVHLCGGKDFDHLKNFYKDSKVEIRLFDFLKDMKYAYSIADLVISRAGASAINEIMFYRIPALISPYPYALNHQKKNAKVLQEAGGCIIIDDNDFNSEAVIKFIRGFLNDRGQLRSMSKSIDGLLKDDGAERLADLALSLN